MSWYHRRQCLYGTTSSHVHFGVPGDESNSHNPTQSDSRMIRMCQSFAEKAKLRYQIVKQICCICSSTYFDVSSWALNWPHKDKTKSCFSIFHAYKLTLALSWVQRSVWGRRGETRRQWHRRCHRHPETPRCSSDRWHPRCATQCLAGFANWKRWNQALGSANLKTSQNLPLILRICLVLGVFLFFLWKKFRASI